MGQHLNKTIDRAIMLLAMFFFLGQLIEKMKEDAMLDVSAVPKMSVQKIFPFSILTRFDPPNKKIHN